MSYDMLDSIDREILRFLLRYGRWATTNLIADKTNTAWATAKKHLEELAKQGYVTKGRRYGNIYWKINE